VPEKDVVRRAQGKQQQVTPSEKRRAMTPVQTVSAPAEEHGEDADKAPVGKHVDKHLSGAIEADLFPLAVAREVLHVHGQDAEQGDTAQNVREQRPLADRGRAFGRKKSDFRREGQRHGVSLALCIMRQAD